MTKRLSVELDDADLRTVERLARRDELTTAEWVRHRLLEAVAACSRPDTEAKLAAIRKGYSHEPSGPAPDIDQMLEEIEQGYRSGVPEP